MSRKHHCYALDAEERYEVYWMNSRGFFCNHPCITMLCTSTVHISFITTLGIFNGCDFDNIVLKMSFNTRMVRDLVFFAKLLLL